MPETAICCSDVSFSYQENGRDILKHTTLTIPSGKITVLMGSSGCGKSTLAALLCGLLPENGGVLKSGEIRLYGRTISEIPIPERAGLISMMFQNPDLQFCMPTLREELIFCAENISVLPDEIPERVLLAAKQLGTEDLLDRPLHTLSGGEKQRAMLSCIRLLDARCIVLDEAFANLDPEAVKSLLPALLQLCREEGKTILAIDHMSDHWQGIADRFVLLGKEGTVLCEAESDEELLAARSIFVEEGIAYPGIWEKKDTCSQNAEAEGQGVALKNLSISGEPRKKTWLRKCVLDTIPLEKALYEDADAFIPKGKITAIMGSSGCGKTTLMMTLLKQREYLGEIRLSAGETRELRTIPEKKWFEEIGIAFQNPSNQFVTQNVLEEVLDGIRRRYPKLSAEEQKLRALELLDSCGLRRFQKYSPYMLSQGQQRRLAVLAVLASGGSYLLLDEPTYGQDYRSARALMDLVSAKVREEGLTVLMSTHDAGLAGAYADRILSVKNRKIVVEGSIDAN